MNVTLFGATGSLGSECLLQLLGAGHTVTVLARTPSKLPSDLRDRIRVIPGDGLRSNDVAEALPPGTDAVLFAVGIDRRSPEDLCTDVTRNILASMRSVGTRRLIWCGGGATFVEDDVITFGAKFVEAFSRTLMGLRHRDKVHQLELLNQNRDIDWIGIRPLQMKKGAKRAEYRLGFDAFNGFSSISFADCAHAMIRMLSDDTWLHKAPIIQY
jgi:putative NADH-flavin reductase